MSRPLRRLFASIVIAVPAGMLATCAAIVIVSVKNPEIDKSNVRYDKFVLFHTGLESCPRQLAVWHVPGATDMFLAPSKMFGDTSLSELRDRYPTAAEQLETLDDLPSWSYMRKFAREGTITCRNWTEYARGWPWIAAVGCSDLTDDGRRFHHVWRIKGFGEETYKRHINIPYKVVWRGFTANSLIYGTILLAPLIAVRLRQLIRHNHGCCWRCGYDLRLLQSVRCPECGEPTEDGRWKE